MSQDRLMFSEMVDDPLRAAGEFWQATLDSLAANIAILDEHGDIIAVNAAWSSAGF